MAEEDDLGDVQIRRRKVRRYNRAVRVHETPFDIAAPDDNEDKPNLRLKPALGRGIEDDDTIPMVMQPDVPPPPRRDREGDRETKNWILPPKPDDLETDESLIPSGWGWLADELRQQQMEADRDEQLGGRTDSQSEDDADVLLFKDKVQGNEYSTWDLFQPASGWKPATESSATTLEDAEQDDRKRDEADRYRNVLDGQSEDIDDPRGFGRTENLMEGGGKPVNTILSRNTEARDLENEPFSNMKKALSGLRPETDRSGAFSAYRAELERTANALLGATDKGLSAGAASSYGREPPSFSRSPASLSQPALFSGSLPNLSSPTASRSASSGLGGFGSSFDDPGRLQPFQASEPLKPVQPLQDLRRQNTLRPYSSLTEQYDTSR